MQYMPVAADNYTLILQVSKIQLTEDLVEQGVTMAWKKLFSPGKT